MFNIYLAPNSTLIQVIDYQYVTKHLITFYNKQY